MSDRKRPRVGRCIMCLRKRPIEYHEKCTECRKLLAFRRVVRWGEKKSLRGS